MNALTDLQAIAVEALAALDTGHQIQPFSSRTSSFNLDDAYRVTAVFEIDLKRDGTVVDHGLGTNVLGGPVSALRHLIDLLARDQVNPALAAGEIITTGTLTRAFAVSVGETWTTELTGLALHGLCVRFA